MCRKFKIQSVEYNKNTGVVEVHILYLHSIDKIVQNITITKINQENGKKKI